MCLLSDALPLPWDERIRFGDFCPAKRIRMKGSLEPTDPRYVTPKKARLGETSPEYTPASVVPISPISNVREAAIANSMQEEFEKKMGQAGKSRRQKKKASRKTRKQRRRRSVKRSS